MRGGWARPSLASAVAVAQGGSYVGFGGWLLLARDHYQRVHRLRGSTWVLNAHAMWMVLVGAVLVSGGLRGRSERPEIRQLGCGAALGLAINDVASGVAEGVAPIYYSDLAWELSLAALWLAARRQRTPRRL